MTDTTTIPAQAVATTAGQTPRAALAFTTGTTVPALGRARAFTTWIEKRSAEDPGVRAALRRGVGKDLDEVPFMHRHVASWLSDEQTRDRDVQRAHYTVAVLIAAQRRDQYNVPTADAVAASASAEAALGGAQPAAGPVRGHSLGRAFADGAGAGLRESSAETRLNLLTRQSVDGLHRHLPAVTRQLREHGVAVDWAQLLVDLCRWRRHSGDIKRRWLQEYYRALQADGEHRAREADQHNDAADAATTPEA